MEELKYKLKMIKSILDECELSDEQFEFMLELMEMVKDRIVTIVLEQNV